MSKKILYSFAILLSAVLAGCGSSSGGGSESTAGGIANIDGLKNSTGLILGSSGITAAGEWKAAAKESGIPAAGLENKTLYAVYATGDYEKVIFKDAAGNELEAEVDAMADAGEGYAVVLLEDVRPAGQPEGDDDNIAAVLINKDLENVFYLPQEVVNACEDEAEISVINGTVYAICEKAAYAVTLPAMEFETISINKGEDMPGAFFSDGSLIFLNRNNKAEYYPSTSYVKEELVFQAPETYENVIFGENTDADTPYDINLAGISQTMSKSQWLLQIAGEADMGVYYYKNLPFLFGVRDASDSERRVLSYMGTAYGFNYFRNKDNSLFTLGLVEEINGDSTVKTRAAIHNVALENGVILNKRINGGVEAAHAATFSGVLPAGNEEDLAASRRLAVQRAYDAKAFYTVTLDPEPSVTSTEWNLGAENAFSIRNAEETYFGNKGIAWINFNETNIFYILYSENAEVKEVDLSGLNGRPDDDLLVFDGDILYFKIGRNFYSLDTSAAGAAPQLISSNGVGIGKIIDWDDD